MKSPERQLHEWLTNDIILDLGGARYVFSRDEITNIAAAFVNGDFAYLRMIAGIRVDNLRYCRTAWDAFYDSNRKHPNIDPQWLLRFSNVSELMFVLMNLPEAK